MAELPVMVLYHATVSRRVGMKGAGPCTSVRHLRRFIFLMHVCDPAGRDAAVKRVLDGWPPAGDGYRRGPADVTWDLATRELTVRVVDREVGGG
jgi:hypothetical protein